MMEISQPGTPDFSRTLILPNIFNWSNFEHSVFSILKVEGMERKRKKKRKNKTRKNSILVGVNEHNQKKDG